MALTVATNTGALMAQAAASSVNKEMETSMERLSTGKRINSAADDAAGVAIASRLNSEIKGTNQAIRNAMDGQAMIDTAEGAHQEIENILQRMRELAVQASNDSNSDADRTALQSEVTALVSEIDRIANVSTWAGKGLIDAARTFKFNVGSHGGGHNEISTTTTAMTGAALGVAAGNASVGVNGATLKEVGENVLQVGGTPVTGDVYNFTLNGQAVKIELTDDAGSAANFDYKVTIGSGSATTTVSSTVDQGKTAAGVADIIAQAINHSSISGNHPGITASAAANDGSVTITQTIAVTGGYDIGGTAADIAVQTADTASVVLAGGTTTDTFLADKTFKITGESAYGDSKDTQFSINGVLEVDATGTELAAAGFAKTAKGFAEYAATQLAAKTDLLGLSFRVGSKANDVYIEITQTSSTLISGAAATAKESTTALKIDTQSDASAAIATVDAAIVKVNSQRAALGAVSNRLDSTVSNLTNISNNLAAGKGRIEDADFAAETTNLAKTQILQQASTAMLAQANAAKQNVLSLLQG